jgi:hypothetical protein
LEGTLGLLKLLAVTYLKLLYQWDIDFNFVLTYVSLKNTYFFSVLRIKPRASPLLGKNAFPLSFLLSSPIYLGALKSRSVQRASIILYCPYHN